MKATRNTVRLRRNLHVPSPWEALREWARKNLTNEQGSELLLALATAVSICYLATRLYAGLQNYLLFAY